MYLDVPQMRAGLLPDSRGRQIAWRFQMRRTLRWGLGTTLLLFPLSACDRREGPRREEPIGQPYMEPQTMNQEGRRPPLPGQPGSPVQPAEPATTPAGETRNFRE